MDIKAATFDLWVFCKHEGQTKYFLIQTSQEKADKYFGGGRFWQIPAEFFKENEAILDSLKRCLCDFNLKPKLLWTAEHVYTIYNRRRNAIEVIPVFAAETDYTTDISLTWEHSEYQWLTAEQCKDKINYKGLIDGLNMTRTYITERAEQMKELLLWSEEF